MSTKSIWKLSLAATVLALLAVFIFQNREILELRFLFWKFEARRAAMLLVVFGGGLGTGWVVATISQLRERGREATASRPPRS